MKKGIENSFAMEQKKTLTADLEHSRHTRWLLGLVLALAIVVAALEFTSSNTEGSLDDLLSEEIPEDMEFVPNVENDEQLEALQPQAPVLAEELVEVTDAQTDVNNQEVVSPPPLDIAVEIDPSIDDLVLADTPVEVEQNDSEEPLPMRVVEQLPQFPGGTPLFIKWLTKNLKYPESAKRQNIQGRVMVSFVVNADGTTTDEKIITSVDPMLDRETLRVIRMMPRWEPGIYNGQPCRTLVYLPVVFKI